MNPLPLLHETTIGHVPVRLSHLPSGLVLDPNLALVFGSSGLSGQVVYTATGTLFEARATRTPSGDYLLMFPTNTPEQPTGSAHYNQQGRGHSKINRMLAFRSKDRGATWEGPVVPFDPAYNQHAFIPLIPRGGKRIYAFGTQPIGELCPRDHGQQENAPIGYRYSDDDGYQWSEVRLIHPVNDPGFAGMSAMRMCELDTGTWLLGSHEADWSFQPIMTRQYVLRSPDQGKTWSALPNRRHGGWCVPQFNRMDEGRPISLGGCRALIMIRTCEGHLWISRTEDDGLTWSHPEPTPLVHPDAPPMLFHLSDGKTLAALHHNRHHDLNYGGLDGSHPGNRDRSEIWVSLSDDEGRTWSAPRFVFATVAEPNLEADWSNWQCSYLDAFADEGILNLFVPHRWQRCLHLSIREDALHSLPESLTP